MHAGNMTMSCNGPVLAYDWLASGSDNRSGVFEMPSDQLLMGWAREKLSLPAQGFISIDYILYITLYMQYIHILFFIMTFLLL